MQRNAMFEWDDARYFLALHRAGTLSAAARSLGVNQTTVGRRLAALEESLGTRVFVKTRDGYRASPAGERLVEHAERMENEVHAIARAITGQETRLTGSVRVTAPDELGARVVTPILAELHAKYPDIEIEVDADNRVRNLTKREAELAVRVGQPVERTFVARKVCDFAQTLYASRAYVERRGKLRGLDFEGHDVIGFTDALSGPLTRWLAENAVRARVPLRSASTHAQLQAARAGVGIAMLPCYLADDDDALVRLVEPPAAVRSAIWLVMHPDLQHTARIRICADFLADRIKADAKRFAGARSGAKRSASSPPR